MGSDQPESGDDYTIVATEEEILCEARNRGLAIGETEDGLAWEISNEQGIGFFPKAFAIGGYGGYPQEQMR